RGFHQAAPGRDAAPPQGLRARPAMVARQPRRAARHARQGRQADRPGRGQGAGAHRPLQPGHRQGAPRRDHRRRRRVEKGRHRARRDRPDQGRRRPRRPRIRRQARRQEGLSQMRRDALRTGLIGLVVPLVLLGAWEAESWAGLIRPNLLPPPLAVVATVLDLARRGELWGHIEITLLRVLFGFAIGTAAATICGALTGYSQVWRRLLDPTLQALRSIPSIAWVPLFILWLGIFEAAKVTLIAVGVFFPVYLNLMAGIEGVDRRLVEVGRVYR